MTQDSHHVLEHEAHVLAVKEGVIPAGTHPFLWPPLRKCRRPHHYVNVDGPIGLRGGRIVVADGKPKVREYHRVPRVP